MAVRFGGSDWHGESEQESGNVGVSPAAILLVSSTILQASSAIFHAPSTIFHARAIIFHAPSAI